MNPEHFFNDLETKIYKIYVYKIQYLYDFFYFNNFILLVCKFISLSNIDMHF